jgi:NAD(P)-dependent dehydrogenase (short-subunit alcohol dehydrogenase family)
VIEQEANMTSSSLNGKTFIVTGAGGAIASAINVAFLEAGANLALADRPGNAELAAERLGAERAAEWLGAGFAVTCDLTSSQGAQAMVQATLEHFG